MSLPRPILWLVTTALRLFPWPARAGLRPVGEPGPDSPVLLTGNFALSVDRVERALRGRDAWLLVASSGGINVWCGSAGGQLTTHDAVSALKTSGVGEEVNHRRLVLPQLAATGIEAEEVRRRTGWDVVWGPVYARDIPNFLAGKGGPSMRRVHFGLGQRLEMAITWAVPISLLASITLLFWARGFTSLLVLIWGVTLTVYAAFPLYEDLVQRGGFGALTALFGGLTVAGVIVAAAVRGSLELPFLLRWTGLGLATVVLVGFDLAGSTPLYKSWSHEERRYDVALDGLLCTACGQCAQVCPRGVFEVGDTACVPHAERCEQCGACIVQCPVDALSFITPEGDRITPDIIRRYKLNLLGKRRVGSGSA